MYFPLVENTVIQIKVPYKYIGRRFLLIFQKKSVFFLFYTNVLLIFTID